MLFSSQTLVSAGAALLALCNVAAAAPQATEVPTLTVPAACTTIIDDFEHTTAYTKTHSCYTRTMTVPSSSCPTYSCAARPTDAVCPQIIKVSSVTVPCATDCCPFTTTSLEYKAPCPTCADCPIPTQWITYTTGCPGTPTITSQTIVTPPWNTPGGI
ncbi:hypothetical protein GGS26DRAFT_588660 [Hypomontagnella submonticulosa]|nr:hypothetical protein GGS26DRAFT_588660 [Hypomontagnella submonticulosa]